MHRKSVRRAIASCSLLAAAVLAARVPDAVADSSATQGAVATENETATRAGVEVLRAGGNAVDAAIAAALVLGVANPTSSGIGGGGFALVWDPTRGLVTALDFRESAPAGLDARSLDRRPVPDERRGLLVGVPGEVAGLLELHRRWGSRLFALNAQPAVRAAEQGFPISAHMARALTETQSALRVSPALAGLFFTRSGPRSQGQEARNPLLGSTLRLIASGGKAAFYSGPVAADIAAAVQRHGGKMTPADLASYQAVQRTALRVAWEGYDVYTMPPPSAGGLLLGQFLGMVPRAELVASGEGTAATLHLMAELFRSSVADRLTSVGDPAFVSVPMERLLSQQHLGARRARVRADRTHVPSGFEQPEHGTTHLVVADRHGWVVSLTTTVNDAFGARIVAPGSGVVLNDELDDFTPPGLAAAFGMADGGPNAARPGARPVSSMTPTIVVRGGVPVLALGGSGGMRIPGNVVQVLVRMMAFGASAADAVRGPRLSVAMDAPTLLLEQPWPSAAQVQALRDSGEQVEETSFPAAVQAVAIDRAGGFEAASDPRKFGVSTVLRGP